MRILELLAPILAAGALVVLAACASATATEPALESTADDSPQVPSVSTVIGMPVPRSDVGTVFAKTLSSGLSVADVTENALPSVAQIIAGSNTGTGFIINEEGLMVTNKHVVQDNSRVAVRLATRERYQGTVTKRHSMLDLAYVKIDSNQRFTPIAIGDSDRIRVGDDVIAIGFPLGLSLGLDHTVSVGIISAKRLNQLQTDASLNPGNSGGPLLDMFGQAVGVIVSRMETNEYGRPVAGIGFAIPINTVRSGLGGQFSRTGRALPTPTPKPPSTIAATPNIEATKAALDAMDAHRRRAALATRTAVEAREEAQRYAASLEATRVAELPTPTPEPTPTPLPTPTPHPRTFCQEWEALVLDWIKQGNIYHLRGDRSGVPNHPQLSARQAHQLCLTEFPRGVREAGRIFGATVGDGPNQLLPGTYEYRREGDKRVPKGYHGDNCKLILNYLDVGNHHEVEMPYGEPFTFRVYKYHNAIYLRCSEGGLYRIGD